jgi:type IV fimbrial biogenesis protein FimT
MPRHRLNRGYTLIELMTALSVAAILLGAGIPALTTFVRDQRLVTATNALVLSLNYARDEAVKRDSGAGIRVCASSDRATCNSADWRVGWIVLDVAAAANPVLDAVAGPNATVNLVETNGTAQVTFLPNGSVAAPVTFLACDSRGSSKARELEVNAMGRIASGSAPGQSVAGGALACP